MAYIGRGTENISNVEVLDNLTFNGSASYTLQKSSTNFVPSSANNLLISISGVVQQGNFSVSGSTITFDTTVSASDTCDWILHYGTGLITTVADGAITEAKLGSNAVTTAKINNGAVTYAKTDGNFGKIGQVIQAVKTDTQSTTSTSFVDISGISVSITPSSTSSKIFITANISGGHVINDTPCYFQLKRDTTDIYLGTTATGSRINASGLVFEGNDSNHAGKVSMSFVDEPSSTSAITYKVQFKSYSGSAVYINRSSADVDAGYNARQASSLIVMEVLA
jgi:hypothetical protein